MADPRRSTPSCRFHLQLRSDNQRSENLGTATDKIRATPMTSTIFKEMSTQFTANEAEREKKRRLEKITSIEEFTDDVSSLLELQALTCDVNPGQMSTSGQAATSFTSSSMSQSQDSSSSSQAVRLATAEELREARWRKLRQLDQKAYVQLQTTAGNINLEIYCNWIHRASWNFIHLCLKGYYDNTIFHRVIPCMRLLSVLLI